MKLKNLFWFLTLFFTSITIVFANETISVVASKFPNAEILQAAKPILKAQGYNLEVVEINSYTGHNIVTPYGKRPNNPNLDVINGKYDANFFQPLTYIQQYNKLNDSDLAIVESVIYVPFAIFITKSQEKKDLPINTLIKQNPGLVVGIPTDYIDQARALKLLEANGLIKLDGTEEYPNLSDITSNPYKLNLYQADNVILADMLKNNVLDLAVMNSGRAYLKGIKPDRFSIIENNPLTYANVVVTTKEKSKSAKILALIKALHSPEVKNVINNGYGGLIKPVY